MRITDAFSAKSIAAQYTEVASNKIPDLGAGFFPAKKKTGLDLKWIKSHKGLPVSLAPSNFDAKSVLRSRDGIKIDQTEMAFFRESMLVKEADEQEIMRVQDAADPYAQEVLTRVYDDANNLIAGANVVAERMRMQLLAPVTNLGHPGITISANGVQYTYNYDADNSYYTNNFTAISTTNSKWNAPATADPLHDLETCIEAVEARTGTRPTIAIMSRATFNLMKKCASVKSAILAQNPTANVFMSDAVVKAAVLAELGVNVIIYTKQYKDEAGTAHQYYPDNYVTLLPEGALGSTWYGVTPEERTLMGSGTANVSIVDTGVAVAVSVTNDPVNTKTTVSEIVLPSYERMDETHFLQVVS